MTRKKERERERILKMYDMRTGQKKKKKKNHGRMMRRKEGQADKRLEGRRLTKGLSSLGRRDGRPCFGRLPFGRVNTDPRQRGRAARGQG